MLSKEQYLDAHSRFYDLLQKEELLFNKYLSYEEYRIPSSYASGGLWMVFHRMASDFISELLSEINQFCSILRNLVTWEEVLKNYSEDMRFNILVEIVEPISINALNTPYVIKNRFIYVSVMLLRETATLLGRNVECIKFSEEKISFETLNKFECLFEKQEWKSVRSFLDELNRIHAKQYKEGTSDFRNRFHHRLPPKIEIGLSSLVTRTENKNGGITYGVGGEFPLSISKISVSLQSEHESCTEAFKSFWLLLKDLLKIWKEKYI